MAKYRIKIDYSTGNSFGSSDTSDYLELEWDELDIAKENLKAIKEHYKFKNKITQEICKYFENNFWFVKEYQLYSISKNQAIEENKKHKYPNDTEYRYDMYYVKQCINLKADNGNLMRISCFWIGYFENLIGAKIEIDESDLEFTI